MVFCDRPNGRKEKNDFSHYYMYILMATFDVSKIKSYTNSILKEECKKHKLKVGGTKKDLCERLEEFYREKEDKDVEELEKKMKKLQVKNTGMKGLEKKMKKLQVKDERSENERSENDEEKARVIYPDISPSTIAFACKQGIGLVEWARRLKKTRKERDEYWAIVGI